MKANLGFQLYVVWNATVARNTCRSAAECAGAGVGDVAVAWTARAEPPIDGVAWDGAVRAGVALAGGAWARFWSLFTDTFDVERTGCLKKKKKESH